MELALLQFWQDNTTVSSDNLSQTTKPLYKVLLGLFMKPGHTHTHKLSPNRLFRAASRFEVTTTGWAAHPISGGVDSLPLRDW